MPNVSFESKFKGVTRGVLRCETSRDERRHWDAEDVSSSSSSQELELRIETQKQTLASRDESIKKLMEMLQSKGVGAFDSVLGYDKLVTGIVEPPFGAIASSVLNAGAGAASCRSIDRLLATLPHQTALTSALGRQQSGCPVQNANHGIFSTSALNDLSALLA
ncbi:hypothetical protein HPB52_019452 [Rhipicephalus sanguineus]|uniref:Uncharacterized protein n=1 Tax=Rhipicephalus sanguineus TaxID=34632 RepID=A0A9D4PNL1_RHISA|nr:hypothetical protein HPB52_019452 [Rhipicephalus sanguineus]